MMDLLISDYCRKRSTHVMLSHPIRLLMADFQSLSYIRGKVNFLGKSEFRGGRGDRPIPKTFLVCQNHS